MRTLIAVVALSLALAACKPDVDAEQNRTVAQTFMAENAKKPGIQTLPSGVQYQVVKSGPAGGKSPTKRSLVKVHYEGKLIDGEIFDSSYERGQPAVMHVDQLIPAWIEALQKMKPGDVWTLYVPPEQGYGEHGAGAIPPNSVLIFKIELLDVA